MYGLFIVQFVPYEAELVSTRIALECGSAWPTEYWAWRHVHRVYHQNQHVPHVLIDVRPVDGPMEGHEPKGENGKDYFCGHCREMEAYLRGERWPGGLPVEASATEPTRAYRLPTISVRV